MDKNEELAFLTFDDPEAAVLLAGTPKPERYDHWHFVTPSGDDLVGGRAAIALFEQFGRTKYLARAVRMLRLTPLIDAGDLIVKKLRPRLSRYVADEAGPMRYP